MHSGLGAAVLESNFLEKWSIKLWLQLFVSVFVDNVCDLLFPADVRWAVGVALQSLSSTDVNDSLSYQKSEGPPADYHPIHERDDHVELSSGSLNFYSK